MSVLSVEHIRVAVYQALLNNHDLNSALALSRCSKLFWSELRDLIKFLRLRKNERAAFTRWMALTASPLVEPMLMAATENKAKRQNVRCPTELCLAMRKGEKSFLQACEPLKQNPEWWRKRTLDFAAEVGYEPAFVQASEQKYMTQAELRLIYKHGLSKELRQLFIERYGDGFCRFVGAHTTTSWDTFIALIRSYSCLDVWPILHYAGQAKLIYDIFQRCTGVVDIYDLRREVLLMINRMCALLGLKSQKFGPAAPDPSRLFWSWNSKTWWRPDGVQKYDPNYDKNEILYRDCQNAIYVVNSMDVQIEFADTSIIASEQIHPTYKTGIRVYLTEFT